MTFLRRVGGLYMKLWNDCLFLDNSDKILDYFASKNDSLLILGKGFDPRACTILEKLKPIMSELSVWLIDYNDRAKKDDGGNESRSENNYKHLLDICDGVVNQEIKVPLYGGNENERTLVISESVRNVFISEKLQDYKHILIDVSAMPRGVAFSIIKRILDIKSLEQNIYILVCENSECDDKIKPVLGEESAEYLPGFNTFSMSMESDNDENIIWLPILGMNEEVAFRIIDNYLKPVEICPVVPFPSKDIRRGENILRCYGQPIFRENSVEKRNIIYVPENHPILVYQKLYDTVKYYEKALNISKGNGQTMKYAFSSQSSKLIDIGVLLAIINLNKENIKTGIVVVENQGYVLRDEYNKENERLYCLCLNDNEFNW